MRSLVPRERVQISFRRLEKSKFDCKMATPLGFFRGFGSCFRCFHCSACGASSYEIPNVLVYDENSGISWFWNTEKTSCIMDQNSHNQGWIQTSSFKLIRRVLSKRSHKQKHWSLLRVSLLGVGPTSTLFYQFNDVSGTSLRLPAAALSKWS